MKKSIIITVLFVATLLWAFSAEAQWWGRGGGGRGAGPCWQGDTYGLNLTQDQTAKLNSLHQAFWKDTAALNTRIEQKQLELKGLLLEPNPDAGKIASLQKEISGLQLQFNEKSVSCQLEARKILTPEQIAQLPGGLSGVWLGWARAAEAVTAGDMAAAEVPATAEGARGDKILPIKNREHLKKGCSLHSCIPFSLRFYEQANVQLRCLSFYTNHGLPLF